MFETTKLSPVYNGYQYLAIFIVAVVLDIIIHFFSARKFTAYKAGTGTSTIGFAPELNFYYRSLAKKGPFPIEGNAESFYGSCNSWLMGALIAGTIGVIVLLLTDLILNAIEYRNNST